MFAYYTDNAPRNLLGCMGSDTIIIIDLSADIDLFAIRYNIIVSQHDVLKLIISLYV